MKLEPSLLLNLSFHVCLLIYYIINWSDPVCWGFINWEWVFFWNEWPLLYHLSPSIGAHNMLCTPINNINSKCHIKRMESCSTSFNWLIQLHLMWVVITSLQGGHTLTFWCHSQKQFQVSGMYQLGCYIAGAYLIQNIYCIAENSGGVKFW